MRTVEISELEHQLTGYLTSVRNGEEIVINEQNKAIARIVPIRLEPTTEQEAKLVALGHLKMPLRATDWDRFFNLPAASVPTEVAVRAVFDDREER